MWAPGAGLRLLTAGERPRRIVRKLSAQQARPSVGLGVRTGPLVGAPANSFVRRDG